MVGTGSGHKKKRVEVCGDEHCLSLSLYSFLFVKVQPFMDLRLVTTRHTTHTLCVWCIGFIRPAAVVGVAPVSGVAKQFVWGWTDMRVWEHSHVYTCGACAELRAQFQIYTI